MNRLDILPERQFARRLTAIEREIRNIKNKQTMGRDIITQKATSLTDDAYDVEVEPLGFISTTILFTADNQSAPNGIVVADVYVGSLENRPEPADFTMYVQDITWGKTDGKFEYFITITNHIEETLYLKYYVYASDTGVAEIVV